MLWYDLNVTTSGNFFIWALANGPDTGSDTMWVSVDGNADQQLTLPTPVNTWGWVKLNTTAINIPAGKHTLKVKVREDGALIDKLALHHQQRLHPQRHRQHRADLQRGRAAGRPDRPDGHAGQRPGDGVLERGQRRHQLHAEARDRHGRPVHERPRRRSTSRGPASTTPASPTAPPTTTWCPPPTPRAKGPTPARRSRPPPSARRPGSAQDVGTVAHRRQLDPQRRRAHRGGRGRRHLDDRRRVPLHLPDAHRRREHHRPAGQRSPAPAPQRQRQGGRHDRARA